MNIQKVMQKGFTLTELMIAVAIIGILASIALPSYTEYIIRSNRAAAKSEILAIANREEQFLLANRAYVGKTALEASGYSLPAGVAAKYTYTVVADNAAAPPTFTITFTPTGSQAGDGNLALNSAGVKTGKWQ